jgi:hypothetical protein
VIPIAHADIELLERVLRYAPDGEARAKIDRALAAVQRAPAASACWSDITPAHAAVLFEELVWLRLHFEPREQPAIDRILARLAAVKKGPSA